MANKNRNWKTLNKRYVHEGYILFSPHAVNAWVSPKPNGRGRPFVYCKGLICFSARIRSILRLGFRQLQGALEALKQLFPIKQIADYTTLWRRVVRLGDNLILREDEANTIIIDSTGMSKQERGFHLGQKWRKRRDFIKLHLAVDENGKVKVSLVTPERGGGDAAVGERMLSNLKAKKLLADGSYDSKKIFKQCEKKNIIAGIPTRRNACPKPLADPLRTKTIKEQRKDMDKWKKKVKYKDRWIIERTISAFKRRFGDATRAKEYHQQSVNNMMATFMLLQAVI